MLLDGAVVDPVPVAPTLGNATDLTIAVDLSGPVESQPVPPISPSLISPNGCRQRILKFVETMRPARGSNERRTKAFAPMPAAVG